VVETLTGVVRERGASIGGELAIRFKEGEAFVGWTWAELWEHARRAAMGLLAAGVRPGDHLMLLLPEPRAAVAAHFGVWAMGGVPTHVGLPYRLHDVGAFVAQLRLTGRHLDARTLVISRSLAALGGLAPGGDAGDTRTLVVEDWLEHPEPGEPPEAPGAGPALIQLTSGSTGEPRGVVIPVDRLRLHLESIGRALPATPRSVGVTWLPLHHDMGLVGGLLYPLLNRFVVNVLSPLEFQARPFAWLETMSRFRATHTAAPPSAFAVCIGLARRAAEAHLDLSSLTCAMVGAEVVSPRLLRRFAEAFAPTGFRPEAFFPVYGLAEATVAVTFPEPMSATRVDRIDRRALEREGVAVPALDGAPDPSVVEVTGVGAPIRGTSIRLVDARDAEVPERTVGEILVRSESLMEGYHADAEATHRAVVDGWLRTGDLGYVAGGALFITGRKKEVIIKGGHNLSPVMLEDIASAVPGVRAGCVAAVGVRSADRETELVYVVAETRLDAKDHPALRERVREALKAHSIAVDHVRLVPPGTLPKTTSGKIRRAIVAASIAAEAT